MNTELQDITWYRRYSESGQYLAKSLILSQFMRQKVLDIGGEKLRFRWEGMSSERDWK